MAVAEHANELLLMARQRYTQKQLAELLEVTPKTISRWESGQIPLKGVRLLAVRHIVQSPDSIESNDSFTFVDLFAGIGGTRIGCEANGGKCVFTSEWDKHSQKTYSVNFCNDGDAIAGDITEIESQSIPDHDLLIAGFPCQPFSIAGVSKKNALGTPHGFDCERQGNLFFDVARVISEKQPRAFLLENVKNLHRHDKGRTFSVIMNTLQNELGYTVYHKIIDARNYVPQHRERIFIVGFRDKTEFDWDKVLIPDASPTLESILHPQDGSEVAEEPFTVGPKAKVNPKYTLTDHLWDYLQRYAEKHRAKGNGFGFGLVTPENVARTLSARYYKDGSEILVSQGKRKNPRRLTPRECARLMGFPDSFKIPVSDTQAYRQFGNSVVAPVVQTIVKAIKEKIVEVS